MNESDIVVDSTWIDAPEEANRIKITAVGERYVLGYYHPYGYDENTIEDRFAKGEILEGYKRLN